MAGSKRRRGSSGGGGGGKQSSSRKSTGTSASGVTDEMDGKRTATDSAAAANIRATALLRITQRLIEISASEERKKNLMQAFTDAKCPLSVSETDMSAATNMAAAPGAGNLSSAESSAKKRQKVAPSSATSTAAAAAKTTTTTKTTLPMNMAGEVAVSQPVHTDCYWIVLGTHLLNDLMHRLYDINGGTVDQAASTHALSSPFSATSPMDVTPPTSKRAKASSAPETPSGDNERAEVIAEFIAMLSHLLSAILLSDKERLEAACSTSAPSRGVLGRAMLSSTVGAMWAIETLARSLSVADRHFASKKANVAQLSESFNQLDTIQFRRRAFFGAVRAMDCCIHMTRDPKQSDTCGLDNMEPTWTASDLDYFVCGDGESHSAFSGIVESEEVMSCLDCLEREETRHEAAPASSINPKKGELLVSPSISKRSTRSRSTKSTRQAKPDAHNSHVASPSGKSNAQLSEALPYVFQQMMRSTDLAISIEGRVLVRRWTSVVLVWLCQGQLRLLRAAHLLLAFQSESPRRSFVWSSSLAPSDPCRVSDSTFLVAVSCRLLAIVSESGNHCGARAPAGGLDTYVRVLLKEKKKRSKSTRVGARDWAVVVIFFLVKLHGNSLNEIDRESSPLVVNDSGETKLVPFKSMAGTFNNEEQSRTTAEYSSVRPEYEYFPSLHTYINNLCRSAASSVGGPFSAEQSTWTKHILTFAAAMVMRLVSKAGGPMDCQLVNFAITRLADVVQNLGHSGVSGSQTTNNEMDYAELAARFLLATPFDLFSKTAAPKPFSTPRGKKRAQVSDKSEVIPPFGLSTFFSDSSSFSNEEALAMFIRSTSTSWTGQSIDVTRLPSSALLGALVEVVRRAYDNCNGEKVLNTTISDMPVDEKHVGDKRDVSTMDIPALESRPPKRRRGLMKESTVADDGRSSEKSKSFLRLNLQRASIATETLKTLSLCLTVHPAPDSVLLRSLRKSLTSDLFGNLVKLGEDLDAVIVKARVNFADSTRVPIPDPPLDSLSFSSGAGSYDFTHYERSLWTSHIKMCQILGRGASSFDDARSIPNSAKPILINSECRLSVYKHIASVHDCDGENWPLTLPAPHFAIMSANLIVEPLPADREDSIPEQFIVDGCLASIGRQLESLSDLKGKEMDDSNRLYLVDEVPLSLRDTRIFLLAASRLPLDDRLDAFEKLLDLIGSTLLLDQGEDLIDNAIVPNGEAAGFFSRLLVLCVALVNMITYGTSIREILFTQIAVSQIQLPTFVASNEWHRSERCFMGIFADWASPLLPRMSAPANLLCLKEKSMLKLKAVLNRCFSMGFETAKFDRCQLLFAAWSGIGMCSVQGWTKREDEIFPALRTESSNLPLRFLEIHDDICILHLRLNGTSPGNTSIPSPLRVKADLQSMLKRIEQFLDLLLQTYIIDDDLMAQETPAAVYTLFAAIPVYISICMAGFSKSGKDYFSSILSKIAARQTKRRRSYSSESEHVPSDADSLDSEDFESDACADALARLRECCDAFGTAPVHPDFLAVGTRLREGISFREAQDAAHTALRCMTKIVSSSFSQHKKFLKLAISVGQNRSENNLQKRVGLALNLYQWFNHEPAASSVLGQYAYPDDREWKVDIERVCNLGANSLDRIVDGSITKNVEQAKEAWCPNAAQRLIGQLQDQGQLVGGWEASAAELRAGGEWELLLAETLTLACLNLDMAETIPRDAIDCLIVSQKWRSICTSSASHIMPAAALLRFSLAKSGRKPHPFSFQENNQDPYDVAPLQLKEPLADIPDTPSGLKNTVFETVSILSRLCIEGDDNLTTCCHSTASQLVIDSQSFSNLEALQAIGFAFSGLSLIGGMTSEKSGDALTFVIERLISVIEDYGRSSKSEDDASIVRFGRLLTFMGGSVCEKLETIVKNDVHPFSILGTITLIGMTDFDETLPYHWESSEIQRKAISDLVSLLLTASPANLNTRSCIALILNGMCYLENEPSVHVAPVIEAVVRSFSSTDKNVLESFLSRDFCGISFCDSSERAEGQSKYHDHVALLLSYLLSSEEVFVHAEALLSYMMQSSHVWLGLEDSFRDNVLGVVSLFSCRFKKLHIIGARLFDAVESSEESRTLGSLVRFLDFARQFQISLRPERQQQQKSKLDPEGSRAGTKQGGYDLGILPRSCSFVTKSGFHGQHWYNCYTCGLVWDKGCCTLCALVCHKDHDVSYSRYSSFFCDCGAEDGNTNEPNRVSCKCLSTLSPQEVSAIFRPEGQSSVLEPPKDASTPKANDVPTILQNNNRNDLSTVCAGIAARTFREIMEQSVKAFEAEARGNNWHKSLFGVLRKSFDERKKDKSGHTSDCAPSSSGIWSEDGVRLSYSHLRRILRHRRGKPLELSCLDSKSLVPIRAFSKVFQMKLPIDDPSSARLTSKIAQREAQRSVLAADSRGRLVVGEQSSLLFCNAMPTVNVRHIRRSFETTLPRSAVCILSSSQMKFCVIGMKFCKADENRLLVWGTSSVCVTVLSEVWGKISETITFSDSDSPDDESDLILKCEWISGASQSFVAVATSQHIRLYDIDQSDCEKRGVPIGRYNLGFDTKLRDLCFVHFKDCGDVLDSYQLDNILAQEGKLCLFLMLENGRLQVQEMKIHPNEKLRRRDRYFDLAGGVLFPTSGIQLRPGAPVSPPGSTSRSLGSASSVTFLVQSRLLLYKCDSSPVLAFIFDTTGEIEGSFELLPHSVPSEKLGHESDEYSVVGPFTNWTELGTAFYNGQTYFRLCCIGRSSQTNEPKILSVEFNQSDVFVKEIQWPLSVSMNIGLDSSVTFDGVTAFSSPYLHEESNHPSFGERGFVSILTSGGSLLIFGDEYIDVIENPSHADCPSNHRIKTISSQATNGTLLPAFPLTLFEKLKNVSESDDVIFSGDGIGRLSRDSGVFFMCTRREGCTLAISLRSSTSQGQGRSPDRSEKDTSQFVISALRILVGSTSTDCIPSRLIIQGRPVDLSPGTKKWYSLPLTSEEIALGVRAGMVSVGVGPSFDSSNPVIDAIEVFGANRAHIDRWIPRSEPLHQTNHDPSIDYRLSAPTGRNDSDNIEGLDRVTLASRGLDYLRQVTGSGEAISDIDRGFIRLLLQDTALDQDRRLAHSIESLLEQLEPNERIRQSFRDECILLGCSKALNISRAIIAPSTSTGPEPSWNSVRSVLYNLYSAASIARERPMNYLQSMDSIVGSGISSVAVDTSDVLLKSLKNSTHFEEILGGIGGLVDLTLTEMAISLNTDHPHGKHFAKFDLLRSLLLHKQSPVVQRSCEAIAAFCFDHSGGKRGNSSKNDLFTLLEHARLVAYRCDSCGVCPMKETRFTMLIDDFDIDLCRECFELGNAYAESKSYGADKNVMINGQEVGGDTEKITCAQMKLMVPVSLQTLTLEQGEIHSEPYHRRISSEGTTGSDSGLQAALSLSLAEESTPVDLPIGHREYEHFVGRLFGNILDLFSSVLRRDRHGSRLSMLARLLLDLSRCSEAKTERAKKLARELANGASYLIGSNGGSKMTGDATLTLVVCLRSLYNLISPESDQDFFFTQSRESSHSDHIPNDDTRSRLVCDVHNVPAVRRRCARGIHKDRRFYVCGKDRGSRCKFFVWADDVSAKTTKKSKMQISLRHSVWEIFASGGNPLHAKLCSMLEAEILDDGPDEMSPAFSSLTDDSPGKHTRGCGPPDRLDDYFDGAWCSRQKLGDPMDVKCVGTGQNRTQCGLVVAADTLANRGAVLANVSLDLMSHIADHKAKGISRWFSFLCEVASSTSKPLYLRALAKKVLKSLCKGDKSLYHSVRDHFAFGFQMRSLLKTSSTLLNAAILVKEKARLCSDYYERTPVTDLSVLRHGDLIGTQDLISEDYTPLSESVQMAKLLDDLASMISTRSESWRQFCCLLHLPNSHRVPKWRKNENDFALRLSSTAPIISLFWMACCASGSNQIRLFSIIDQALSRQKNTRLDKHGSSSDEAISGKAISSSAFDNLGNNGASPEKIILGGPKKLNVSDLISFAMHFIYNGRTVELRRAAYQVATKLSISLSADNRGYVFRALINPSFLDMGSLGKSCVEYLNFLQFLVPLLENKPGLIGEAADLVTSSLLRQTEAMKLGRSNGNWYSFDISAPGTTSLRKRFDSSSCAFCLRTQSTSAKSHQGRQSSTGALTGNSPNSSRRISSDASPTPGSGNVSPTTARSKTHSQRPWDAEQVCPFTRGRLDSGKESSSSNEFSIFYSLKYRLVISDVYLTISDPRGRFVKAITVYFSPRPVGDVLNLKAEDYSDLWQPCAVLKLARGASRASTSLTHPVVASNLKIEFTEFYDRPGGSKASDGSLLVHCPRCARVVTNAHGVCGNCGEVAFQCRKCRHINYDRLDAFLCVECGYCTSGSFVFELNAGVASNATAVTNDDDYRRCAKLLGTATSLHEGLMDELRKRANQATMKDNNNRVDVLGSTFNAALMRAFCAQPPVLISGDGGQSSGASLDKMGKQGSVVRFIAHPHTPTTVRSSSASDRTRSLLRLARQIRSETGSGPDRRRSSDAIIRHLGRGLTFDSIEDDGDFLSFLDGGSLFDPPDPLGRIVANAQSRGRNEGASGNLITGRQISTLASTNTHSRISTTKEIMVECRKLYLLMRESDREISELSRRLKSWRRLETNTLCINERSVLSALGNTQPLHAHLNFRGAISFSPCHCSVCNGTVTLQLLVLWLSLFTECPGQVNVTPELLSMLFEDSSEMADGGLSGGNLAGRPKTLMEYKHDAIVQIATGTSSNKSAQMVLSEIRKKMTTGANLNCAEILGKIMRAPPGSFPLSEEYTALSMSLLETCHVP